MFDVGFWELGLVALVALLVIGPERLPRVMRVAGFWIGKARSMALTMKQELQQELYAEELRQTLADQSPVAELRDAVEEAFKDTDEMDGEQGQGDVGSGRPMREEESEGARGQDDP